VTPVLVIALASFFLAVVLALHIWSTSEPKFFKALLTILVLVPILGPLAYFWISRWPPSSPEVLRSNYRGQQLDAELSNRGRSRSFYHVTEASLIEKPQFKKSAKSRKIRHSSSALFQRKGTRLSRGMFFGGLVLGAIFLAHFWLLTFLFISVGWPWGYPNYRGESVGTFLILSMLLVATPLYFILAWRHWPTEDASK
jgi:hypothetical protein